jgi:hypothetical protein
MMSSIEGEAAPFSTNKRSALFSNSERIRCRRFAATR